MNNSDKLAAFITSDSRFTRRTLPSILESGITTPEIIAALAETPDRFSADVGIKGDLYFSLKN